MLLLLAALTTAFLESPAAAFLLRRREDGLYVLGISALLNLVTNLVLNGLCLPLLEKTALSGLWNGLLPLLSAELVIAYLAEGFLYPVLVRGVSMCRGMLVSALCNTLSLGLGLIAARLAGTGPDTLLRGYALLCGASGIFFAACLIRGLQKRRERERGKGHGKR